MIHDQEKSEKFEPAADQAVRRSLAATMLII